MLLLLLSAPLMALGNHDREEFWVGLAITHQVEAQNLVIEDHPEEERVMRIAARIVDTTPRHWPYTFAIIRAPTANAFALPGGFIFITDKLLELKLTDDELGFLIGHEVAHIQNHHFRRLQKEQTKVNIANALATIGAAILASKSGANGDRQRLRRQGAAGTRAGATELNPTQQGRLPPQLAPILAGNIFGTLHLLHSRRDFEYEADLSGARLAMNAGFELEGGMGMLKKLFMTNYRSQRYEEWTTHPLTQSRMVALKNRADPDWLRPPRPESSLPELISNIAHGALDLYEASALWTMPRSIPREGQRAMRRTLLERASRFSPREDVERRHLRLELRDHVRPKLKTSPFLLAPYGLAHKKMERLKELGEPIDSHAFAKSHAQAHQSLTAHLKSIENVTPGLGKLDFMIHNFPDHSSVEGWKWERWKRERDLETKLNTIEEWSDNVERLSQAKEHLQNWWKREDLTPYTYLKLARVLSRDAESKKMESILEDWENLEELMKAQHGFPQHPLLPLLIQKRSQLVDHHYRAGRLAMTSNSPQKAVQHFRQVVLFDPGTPQEEEATQLIERLNTIGP